MSTEPTTPDTATDADDNTNEVEGFSWSFGATNPGVIDTSTPRHELDMSTPLLAKVQFQDFHFAVAPKPLPGGPTQI
jgi:hypothetical protein